MQDRELQATYHNATDTIELNLGDYFNTTISLPALAPDSDRSCYPSWYKEKVNYIINNSAPRINGQSFTDWYLSSNPYQGSLGKETLGLLPAIAAACREIDEEQKLPYLELLSQ